MNKNIKKKLQSIDNLQTFVSIVIKIIFQTNEVEEIVDKTGNYTGEVRVGKPEGCGIKYYESGSYYEGEWKDGVKNGYGKITLSNGETYKGEFRNGKRNGNGTNYWNSDGRKYTGLWKDNKADGYGKMTYESGSYYEGEWKDGKEEGYGVFNYNQVVILQGKWTNGKLNGEGTVRMPSYGITTNLNWKEGKPNGKGNITLPGGTTYHIKISFGEDVILNGTTFHNTTVTLSDGSFYHGLTRFENGVMSGIGTNYNATIGAEYVGEWVHGLANGNGKVKYSDGSFYRGEWANGKKNGRGEYSWNEGLCQGIKYKGVFTNDTITERGSFYDYMGGKLQDMFKYFEKHISLQKTGELKCDNDE